MLVIYMLIDCFFVNEIYLCYDGFGSKAEPLPAPSTSPPLL